MPSVGEIRDLLEQKAPSCLKLDFDNVGLLVGDAQAPVERVLLALDITGAVIDEAVSLDAQLIVSHHPLFFSLKSVTSETPAGAKVLALARHGIAAICMHTNLDRAPGGVNDALLAALGAENAGFLRQTGTLPDGTPAGITRLGRLPEAVPLADFLQTVRTKTAGPGLRYHDAGRTVQQLAVCGGSGGGDLEDVIRFGCDTFVTADVKYDVFLRAKEAGVNLIDADHFCTENVVIPVLWRWLRSAWPKLGVILSSVHGQTAQFYV